MGVLRVRIGSRSSKLSKAQTKIVSGLLEKKFGEAISLELVPVKTAGDRLPPSSWMDIGEGGAKKAFTGDLETLLLDDKIDVAIHSMKDLPSEETPGLTIGATPQRSDPRDALVARRRLTLKGLPRGAKVGTSSLRRKAQLLEMRPDLEVTELHGNVDTRLRTVIHGGPRHLDAIVLAVSGLQRIGEGARISQKFSIEMMVPAVGQGIIAVQMRRGDRELERILSRIDDPVTGLESRCERAFAKRIGVDCDVPVGGCARVAGRTIKISGMLADEDGSRIRKKVVEGPKGDAAALGRGLAEELLGGAPGGESAR